MTDLSQIKDLSAAMAAELASDLYPQEEVFQRYGVTPSKGQDLLNNPWFAEMVKEAKAEWDGMRNVQTRLRTKARLTVEESLTTLFHIVGDKNEPASARVAAFKELKDIAAVTPREESDSSGGRASVTIYLGGDRGEVSVGGQPRAQQQHNDFFDANEELSGLKLLEQSHGQPEDAELLPADEASEGSLEAGDPEDIPELDFGLGPRGAD